jgi:hypothetical protein
MKTAIQELFSQLAIEHPGLFNVNTLAGREFINNYYKFFEMEKQQMLNAFIKAEEVSGAYDMELEFNEYYNETFKLNNHE